MPHDYIAARAAAAAAAALPPRMELWIEYARKSSESSERQMLSIPSQLEHMHAAFPNLNKHPEPVTESRSAFHPGRKRFGWIIQEVEAGHITGIISWHPNRLSRNAEDAAVIIRLVKSGKLDLRFVTFAFEKTPEGLLLLQQMLSQGEYDSERLARDVERGTSKKVEQGWFPGSVPLGYTTDGLQKEQGERTVIPDPARLPIVQRAMEYALTGDYTIAELHNLMANEWGLTTRDTKGRKSRPVSYTTVFGIFRNVFYAGHFI